jgi:hypothetical protein
MSQTERAAGTRRQHGAIRAAGAIAVLAIVGACAATSPRGKSAAAGSAQAINAPERNPSCLTQTGSRASVGGATCTGTGQSFSSDDIGRTGATTVGQALPLLDPAITIHH